MSSTSVPWTAFRPGQWRVPVLVEDALRRAVEIFELSAFYRPKEGKQACQAHPKGDRNQPRQKPRHAVAGRRTSAFDVGAGSRLSESTRSELVTTRIDEVDIATAATRGVT